MGIVLCLAAFDPPAQKTRCLFTTGVTPEKPRVKFEHALLDLSGDILIILPMCPIEGSKGMYRAF